MGSTGGHRRAFLATCASAALLLAAAAPAGASQTEYEQAYALGLRAYTYGVPLLETNKTFQTQTSVNVTNAQGDGPVNRINNVRQLNNPKSKTVVAPGANALSSIAWLDLRREPQVLHVPRVRGHQFVLALLDPFTNDLRNLGTVHDTQPGDYVIAGPGQQHVPIPSGTHRITVNYTRIWMIGSTQLKGPSDLTNVHRIQNRYAITPLSHWGQQNWQPPKPAHPRTTVKTFQLPTGLAFFDVLGQQLRRFPPPAADRSLLSQLRTVGIGPGLEPSKEPRLSADTLRGLRAAAAYGPKQVDADAVQLYGSIGALHQGYLLGGFGQYGTDYALRAVIATVGLGAFTSDQTIFAIAVTDRAGAPLQSANAYVLHLRKPPPVNGGWSLTVYTTAGGLVPNALQRYQFDQSSQLTRNADGSIDLYLQNAAPATAAQRANWLPTPAEGGFEVIWRLLAPQPQAIGSILSGSGWQPPAIPATSS